MKNYGPQYKTTYPADTHQAHFVKQIKDCSLFDLTIRGMFEAAAYCDEKSPASRLVDTMLLNAPKERLQKIGAAYYLEIARRTALKYTDTTITSKTFLRKHFAMVCRRDGIRTQESSALLNRVLTEMLQR